MPLTNQVALVTGGGSGIGEATAILMAQEGARVAVLGRTQEKLVKTVEKIQAKGGEGMPVVGDISKPEQMQQAIAQIIERWGRLDIVFAHAGVNGVWAPLDELAPDEWQKTININLSGTFFTVKYAVPHLKKQGGAIVVTSSVNGTRMFSNTGATAYMASKAGLVAFTKAIALELAEDQIRANVICPGAIKTSVEETTERRDLEKVKEPVEYPKGKIPLTDGKPGSPEQVAQLVLFLVSDASSHITGTEIWIDGAETLIKA